MKFLTTTTLCFALAASIFTYAQQPGTLDGDFDANGFVITSISAEQESANSIAVQLDGKILVTGTTGGSGFNSVPSDFATVRYLIDGSLDPSFGTDGIVITNLGPQDRANSIVIQTDGKIVVGGNSNAITTLNAFALVRYNEHGTIDDSFQTFSDDGPFIGPFAECTAIAIQSDGKILAVGTIENSSNDFLIARYNTDGTLDASFGENGIVTTDFGSRDDNAFTLNILQDGRILVAGKSSIPGESFFATVSYNSDGSLDNSFSANGMVTTDFEGVGDMARTILILQNGKIVVVGSVVTQFLENAIAIVRYNADGTLDNSYGTAGKVITVLEQSAISALLQPDEKIVVTTSNKLTLIRFLEDGTFDTSFGLDGIMTESIGISNANTRIRSSAFQPDGKIVVTGSAQKFFDDSDFAVARIITGLNLGIITFTNKDNGLLIYPNPITERATLEYTLQTEETISIKLYDVSGKLVQSLITAEKRSAGQHKETLALDPSLPHGSYIITLSNGVGNSSVRITK